MENVQHSDGSRFGPRVTASEIAALQETAVPTNTKNNTSLAVNVWNEWSAYRRRQDPSDFPPCLLTMQVSELTERNLSYCLHQLSLQAVLLQPLPLPQLLSP